MWLTILWNRYNSLREDSEQPQVSNNHLAYLAQLFIRHNAQNTFGLHLIHSHFKIPYDTVMLGTTFELGFPGYWTQPELYETVSTIPVHGHIFVVNSAECLLPYEYREGEAPTTARDIGLVFFEELSAYLTSNKLEQLLGLQILEERLDSQLHMEYVIAEQATIMIRGEHAAQSNIYRVTGWTFVQEVDGSISVKGTETHAAYDGVHKIFTDGKLNTVDAGLKFLLRKGVFKTSPQLELHAELSKSTE